MSYITREVYVQRISIANPIPYTRATNAQDIQFRFCDFHIPEGAEAKVYVQKPSGKAVYNTALIQGDIVTVEVTTQMFSELGTSNIQLQLVKEERTLVTFTQPVEVFQNYTEGDAPESQNESGFFGEFVKETGEKAIKIAQDAADEVERRADEGEFTGTVVIGEVVTGEPGSEASVENVGTAKDAVLNMIIPAGKTGEVENIDSVQVAFEEAAERENIESGETMPTLFGKIRKWFSGLKNIAFTASYNDLINAPEHTAVKGNAESEYRTGNVNLTPENIGAISTSKIIQSTNITEPGFVMDGETASEEFSWLSGKTKTQMATGATLETSGRQCSLVLSGATYKSSGAMGFFIPEKYRPDIAISAYVLCYVNGKYYPGLITTSQSGGFNFRSYPIEESSGINPTSAILYGVINWIA